MLSSFIEQQSEAFLVSIVAGVLAGCIVCIAGDLKKVNSKTKVIGNVIDIVCWLILCVIIIWVISLYNSGELRLYIFLGFFSGIGIYFSTIHWVASKIVNYILYHVKIGLKKVKTWAEMFVDRFCSKR
jgi:spore cortex biosynthesis protein YabQ